MEKTKDLKTSSHTISRRTRPKKDRPIIQFGTLEQSKEMMKNAIFPAELRSEFPPNCGLKFIDDPITENSPEKTT